MEIYTFMHMVYYSLCSVTYPQAFQSVYTVYAIAKTVYPAKIELKMHLNNNHRDPMRLPCICCMCVCDGFINGLKNYCIWRDAVAPTINVNCTRHNPMSGLPFLLFFFIFIFKRDSLITFVVSTTYVTPSTW